MSELITAASLQGKAAPGFRLADASGAPRALADFAGKWLVLYFYPKASTPGACCPTSRRRARPWPG